MTKPNPYSSKSQSLLRKAAILVSTLDAKQADALLEQMPAEQSAKVRAYLLSMEDVDPAEEAAIVAEFMRGSSPSKRSEPLDDGVELSLSQSPVALQSDMRPAREAEPASQVASFEFISNYSATDVAEQLRDEHPQIVAVVASRCDPKYAAEILSALPLPLQAEVVRRLARAAAPDPDSLVAISDTLRKKTSVLAQKREIEPTQVHSLRAILGAMPAESKSPLLNWLQTRDVELAVELSPVPVTRDSSKQTDAAAGKHDERPLDLASRAASYGNVPKRMVDRHGVHDDDSKSGDLKTAIDWKVVSTERLAAALAKAPPRTAILAIAGMDEEIVDRFRRSVSQKQWMVLEERMQLLKPMRLKEIETACREVARLAGIRPSSSVVAAA